MELQFAYKKKDSIDNIRRGLYSIDSQCGSSLIIMN